MSGKEHRCVANILAVSMLCISLQKGNTDLAVSAFIVPFASLLPDIDHNNSKLGRKRKEVFDKLSRIFNIAFYVINAVLVLLFIVSNKYIAIRSNVFNLVISIVPILFCIKLATSNVVLKRFKFFTRHRGIMHTLIPVLSILLGALCFKVMIIKDLLFGIAIGYTIHLICDIQTPMGCPILYPISKNNVSIYIDVLKLSSKVLSIIDGGIIICITLILLGLV